MSAFTTFIHSPIGLLEITGTDTSVYSILFVETERRPLALQPASEGEIPGAIKEATRQLNEYFEGKRLTFDLPLQPKGTDFQQHIWNLLLDIPYGVTTSYLEISKRYGDTKAIRAVGAANGSNPITIIIPCHRVIGSNGKLVGYGGDLWRKEWLLKHELEHAPVPQGKLF
ncbi:MAG: methylated-DNA--[protein]-cysteine S-methyltransferase [Saprospiraceae bacterium]|nr:methylated-DNA--[protein]-cysteine S-methyltransferase [Saprospiraceae bacterium]